MSETARPCERFRDVDPLAYLVDREAEEFDAWKGHFPDCPECSAALADVSELEWQLSDLGDAAHPDAVELDAYSIGHGLDAAGRSRIEAHLPSCPMCSDQLRALARFESEIGEAGAAERGADDASVERRGVAGWIAAIGDWLRPVPSPVWAGALVLLLFAIYSISTGPGQSPAPAERIAGQEEPGRAIEEAPSLPEHGVPTPEPDVPPAESLADRGAPAAPVDEPLAPSEAIESPPTTDLPDPGALAEAPMPTRDSPTLAPESPTPGLEIPTPEEAARPELLLAALDLPATLDYRGRRLGSGRLDVLGRGAQPESGAATPIQVLAPKDHRGLAVSTGAVLVWSLSSPRSQTVRLVVVDERQIDPVYEVAIEGPHAAGLHALDLTAQGVVLEPGAEYVWSVALELDPERPSRSPRSQAVLAVTPANAEVATRLRAAPARERVASALEQGLWYDATGEIARAAATRPDDRALRAALQELATGEGILVQPEPTLVLHRP